jgi:hypothetical protein
VALLDDVRFLTADLGRDLGLFLNISAKTASGHQNSQKSTVMVHIWAGASIRATGPAGFEPNQFALTATGAGFND